MPRRGIAAAVILSVIVAASTAGCDRPPATQDPKPPEPLDAQLRRKYGKGIDDLPRVKLVLISPHDTSIQSEFGEAFRRHHALAAGQNAELEWRETQGGGGEIVRHLIEVYGQSSSAAIDVLWGGGDYGFGILAGKGLLAKMELPKDFVANTPPELGEMPLYDSQGRWCGSALSAFGFLYNRAMLEKRGLSPPRQWEDLTGPGYFGQLALTDPTMSGSAAAAYEMIVQSAPNWPAGWARLLDILGNAGRFADSAGIAADAPGAGEALAATCIDFFGTTRVAREPQKLAYVSPPGQTAYTPDPIAILKDPPHPKLAQAFVDFVLSRRGQALWALPQGEPDGPVRAPLGRLPIRRDVYEVYRGKLSPWIQDPYQAGAAATIDLKMQTVRFDVLRMLVRAAAIDNADDLRKAKKRLIELKFPASRLGDFHRLPDNVDTPEKVEALAALLRNRKANAKQIDAIDAIDASWKAFFRDKYARVAK